MVILNFKVNKALLFRFFIAIILLTSFIVLLFSIYRFVKNTYLASNSCVSDSNILDIPSNQYTNVLKEIYENADNYLGKTIQANRIYL